MLFAFFFSITTIMFCCIWIRGEKYATGIKSLKYRVHPLKDLYSFGFGFIRVFSIKFVGIRARKEERYFKAIYGDRYWEFYRLLHAAEKITTSAMVLIIFTFIASVLNSLASLVLGVGLAVGAYMYFDKKINYSISLRTRSILKNLPEVLSKLTLLVGAGMAVREAWYKVGMSGKGVLYKEMQRASAEIQNGAEEYSAYLGVSSRCGVVDVDKFISAFIQNLTKGSGGMAEYLNQVSRESWNSRKTTVRMSGEVASTKLLIPICLMFVGVFIMIIFPIMRGLSF